MSVVEWEQAVVCGRNPMGSLELKLFREDATVAQSHRIVGVEILISFIISSHITRASAWVLYQPLKPPELLFTYHSSICLGFIPAFKTTRASLYLSLEHLLGFYQSASTTGTSLHPRTVRSATATTLVLNLDLLGNIRSISLKHLLWFYCFSLHF